MLERVVGDMLTLFAMMCGEADTSDRVAAPKGRLLRAHMSFTGGVSGALTLIVPFELCREMAANVLGIDGLEDAAARHAGDAIGEFANMACGHLATTLEQREQTKLSPPQVDEAGAEDWDSLLSTPGTVRFMVEELPLLATLALRPE
jgi:chemotaxis protein CheY-P-specific phosphatase CheC